MSIGLQETLSIVAFILAGLFFLTAIVLFFVLRIPNVVGYLTGANRQKAIDSIRNKNVNKHDLDSGELAAYGTVSGNLSMTQKISTARLNDLNGKAGELTTVLNEGNATTVLSQTAGATTVLGDSGATTVLPQQSFVPDSGTVLGSGTALDMSQMTGIQPFTVEFEINYTDSKEIIE